MARLSGSCCGLVVFSALILTGLANGNSVETILVRALVGLLGGLVLGALAGWVVSILVQDQLPTPSERDTEDSPASLKSESVKTVS